MPPMAVERRCAGERNHSAGDGRQPRGRGHAAAFRRQSGGAAVGRELHPHPELERAGSDGLLRPPPLSAGHGAGKACDVRAGLFQPGQSRWKLGLDLRARRTAGDGNRRLGVGHGHRALLPGGRPDRLRGLARSSAARALSSGSRPDGPAAGPGRAGGDTGRARDRRLRRGHRPDLAPGRQFTGRAPDRVECRERYVHGPLGISSAAAVRVGHNIGAGRSQAAGRSGWTAIALGAAVMSCAAAAFLLIPHAIARLYTPDASVIATSVALLAVAAVFQLFDGCQIIAAGALRGAGDTRTPMLCNLLFYWFLGLPLGYALCFGAKWGAIGLWIGLCVALVLIGSILIVAWRRKVRDFPLLT